MNKTPKRPATDQRREAVADAFRDAFGEVVPDTGLFVIVLLSVVFIFVAPTPLEEVKGLVGHRLSLLSVVKLVMCFITHIYLLYISYLQTWNIFCLT